MEPDKDLPTDPEPERKPLKLPKAHQRALDRLAAKIQEQDQWVRSVVETVLPPSYKVFFDQKNRHAVKVLLSEFMVSIETAKTADGNTLSIIYQESITIGGKREILGQHEF